MASQTLKRSSQTGRFSRTQLRLLGLAMLGGDAVKWTMPTKSPTPIAKQTKIREGLTLFGIAAQITHSILVWKTYNFGKRNDCQLVVNKLIRAYHDRMAAESRAVIPSSLEAIEARAAGAKPVLEHAIPVACVMWHLLEETVSGRFEDARDLIPRVMSVLESTAARAWVSKREDAELKKLGLDDRMPTGHEYPWPDRFARYKLAGIVVE